MRSLAWVACLTLMALSWMALPAEAQRASRPSRAAIEQARGRMEQGQAYFLQGRFAEAAAEFAAFLAKVVIISNGLGIAQMRLNRFIFNGFDFAQVNHAVARVFLWRVYGVVFSQNEQLIRFRMLRQCRNAFEIKRLTALNGYLVQFAEL